MKMAVKLSKLVILTIALVLLLSGCSDNQAASTDMGRPNLSDEQTAVNQDRNKPTVDNNVSKAFNEPLQQEETDDIKSANETDIVTQETKADKEASADSTGSDEGTGKAADNKEDEVVQKPADDPQTSEDETAKDSGPTDTETQNSQQTNINQNNGGPATLKFSELYSGGSSRGLQFSDKLKGLAGQKVAMNGYMAPPLKPALTFFVLTREPMAICPFCNSDANWPSDIVLVYMPQGKEVPPMEGVIKVTGKLDIGSYTDEETGFVSQVRIYADKVERVQ